MLEVERIIDLDLAGNWPIEDATESEWARQYKVTHEDVVWAA
jgi:hypothetical protein